MTKKEKIENFIEKYNGYLITSLVCSEDISKTYVAKYIKEHGMEKVSRGLYITDDVWPDELFILQQRMVRLFIPEKQHYICMVWQIGSIHLCVLLCHRDIMRAILRIMILMFR